ncbi:winged helix-turn-helix domain-containing protein [Myxococcota bacterium]|nr:winged helix-turn-helix domain-containing protein [Myxococcota bacterium]
MLESLITSKTRIKLLLRFFLNPGSGSYLRELAQEFGESTNSIRVELNRLSGAGILESEDSGRTKVYRARRAHPLFTEIHNLVTKTVGIDHLIERVLARIGNLESAYIIGDYARGMDSGIIDLVLVGELNRDHVQDYVLKAESIIGRKIRVLILAQHELAALDEKLDLKNAICLWSAHSAHNPEATPALEPVDPYPDSGDSATVGAGTSSPKPGKRRKP